MMFAGQANLASNVCWCFPLFPLLRLRGRERGEGKWESIPFEQAIEEIVNGGVLFKVVAGEENREVELFLANRSHLPKSDFDPEKWKKACGEAGWRKVIYVLTAKPNPGHATDLPIQISPGKALEADGLTGDLHLITPKEVTQTKSRTIPDYWLPAMIPENAVIVHESDADRLSLRDGDRVKMISATNPEGVWDFRNGQKKEMIGQVKVAQTIKPGIVTFTLGYGHWATGAADVTIDGKVIKDEPRRGKGVHLNAAMWIDPYQKNTKLQDTVDGGTVFYDSKVRLIKI